MPKKLRWSFIIAAQSQYKAYVVEDCPLCELFFFSLNMIFRKYKDVFYPTMFRKQK